MTKETDSFRAWKRLFSTEDACLKLLGDWRWRNGYACPKCGHNESCTLSKRQLRQCNKCQHQVSPTAGTALNHVRIPLSKWFAGAYMINAYKDTMTLEVLRKDLDISWRSASRLSKSVQRAMEDPVLSDFLKSQLLAHGIDISNN